jgi:P27 family predicted phage terminase small subunit
MGRNKIPIEIKEARGTLEKSRELKEANRMKPEKVKEDDTNTPSFLNKYGKQFYRFYLRELTKLDILTVTDLEALAMMSAEYGRYIEAQYMLKNSLTTIGTNKNGSTYEQVSPYINIANSSFKNFYNMMSRFGISPADRQKIATYIPEEKNDNSLGEFLNGIN